MKRTKQSELTVLAEQKRVEAKLVKSLLRENGGWIGEGAGKKVYIHNLTSILDGNSKATKLTISHSANMAFEEKMPYSMFDMMISSLSYKQKDNGQYY